MYEFLRQFASPVKPSILGIPFSHAMVFMNAFLDAVD